MQTLGIFLLKNRSNIQKCSYLLFIGQGRIHLDENT